MKKYDALLEDGTTGTIAEDTINYQSAEDFISEVMTVKTKDENGIPIEVTGKLIEVF